MEERLSVLSSYVGDIKDNADATNFFQDILFECFMPYLYLASESHYLLIQEGDGWTADCGLPDKLQESCALLDKLVVGRSEMFGDEQSSFLSNQGL